MVFNEKVSKLAGNLFAHIKFRYKEKKYKTSYIYSYFIVKKS